MKKIAVALSIAVLTLLTSVPVVQRIDGASAEAGGRYKITGEVRREAAGYRHVVIVKNKSRDWLQCNVWTDVDPQPPVTDTVAPKKTREITTRTRAETDTFIPFGFCQIN
jgi:hypothetical protein